MHRGKIIGAVVLVAAIGLVVAQRIGNHDEQESPPAVQVDASIKVSWPAGVRNEYTVDASGTEVYWRVYRAGAMAALGHNHVISVGEIEGTVRPGGDPSAAAWTLMIPVAALIIDDPALRARYGEDFESLPSEEDKVGTRTNMLTEQLLNGAAYPSIRLTGRGVVGALDNAELPVAIELAGNMIDISLPASISFEADAVTVSGEVRLTHEQLGLEPFSIFGGAMAVGENIDFTYRIRAVAGGR